YVVAVTSGRLKAAFAYCLGAFPALGLMLFYDKLAFGNPFTTGYNHVNSELYHNTVAGGLLGVALNSVKSPSLDSLWEITFGAYRGLFIVSPVLVLFFPAVVLMWRQRRLRAELLVCASVVVLYFLMDASRGVDQNGWSGGWSIASRHLTPVLPFMIVPMASGLRHRWFRMSFVPLAALSISLMFMAVVSVGTFSFADHNPVFNELLPHFLHGHVQLNWGYLIGLRGFPSLFPFFGLALVVVCRIVWLYSALATRLPSSALSPAELRAS
ncbi:MAG TPA: hypothetical protein VKX16_13100, partial [Chloroflexota bacterium]|nr:hypothetical protein [Chloroflexota bacterium]